MVAGAVLSVLAVMAVFGWAICSAAARTDRTLTEMYGREAGKRENAIAT